MAEGQAEPFRITLDGNWWLEDLNNFARDYEDLYSAIFHLDAALEDRADANVLKVFLREGNSGFSSLNFFSSLRYAVPEHAKPRILRIRYGSPGALDLNQIADIAKIIAAVVTIYMATRRGGGPPSGTNINVHNSPGATIIVNAITGIDDSSSRLEQIIPNRHQRGNILRRIENKVDRLARFLDQEKITDLGAPLRDNQNQ